MSSDSIGYKIKRVVNILWVINIILVCAAALLAVLIPASYIQVLYGMKGFIIYALLVCFVAWLVLVVAYIAKLFLEGFGQLVEKTESIEEMMYEKHYSN